MDSANLHHHQHQHQHQLQEQLAVGYFNNSSLPTTPSLHGVGINNSTWNQNNLLLNAGNFNNLSSSFNGVISQQNYNFHLVPPSLNTSMIQDLGFQWPNSTTTGDSGDGGDGFISNDQFSAHELHLAKIRNEFSSFDFSSKFNETIFNNLSDIDEFNLASRNHIKHEEVKDLQDISEKLLLKNFPLSGYQFINNNGLQLSAGDHLHSNYSQNYYAGFGALAQSNRGNNKFMSQIFPSINISNPSNQSSTSSLSSSTTMNCQALDLLSSTKVGGSCIDLNHLHRSSLSLPVNNSSTKEARELKKRSSSSSSSSVSATKESAAPNKKPRMESTARSSLSPIKVQVRDRIATLQQLVAPFGKTDMASVLMEATGYIKFLQEQVETLSVPYTMKSARNNIRPKIQRGSIASEGYVEPKQDLRSRGLCLVPLSCTSFFTNDNLDAGIWSSSHFGGRTFSST